MVANSSGYFGNPSKRNQGVMQGGGISLTIFNVVVDAVICHWVMVVMPTEASMGGLGLTIIDLVEYFYSDDVLIALTQMERLQREFDVLTNLFNRVGLQKNMAKMVGMVCQPCHAPGVDVKGSLFAKGDR